MSKSEPRKNYPKLLRDPYQFKLDRDAPQADDLINQARNCDCGTTPPALDDPPPTDDETCRVDEYTFCGTLSYTEFEEDDPLPTYYLRAGENPDVIFVRSFGELGACFRRGDEVACSEATGPLLGLDEYTALEDTTEDPACRKHPCLGVDIIMGACEDRRCDDSPCFYEVSPLEFNLDEAEQEIEINVTAYIGCSWNAVSNDDWLEITLGSAHLSSGSVSITVSENTGDARTGTISLYRGSSGTRSLIETVTVNQEGGVSCSSDVASSYRITDGPFLTASFVSMGPCNAVGLSATPSWDGVMTQTAACSWGAADLGVMKDSWLGRDWLSAYIHFVAGSYWQLTVNEPSGPNEWVGRKTSGSTPIGTYTSIKCSPATLTVA